MSGDAKTPRGDLGPEWAALELLVTRPATPEERRRLNQLLLAPEFDLGRLVEQAMRQKLVGLLATYLEDDELDPLVPEAVRDSLRTLLRANRRRTILLRQETARIARALAERGVRFACTKGIIFESALYGADDTRLMRDVDFMILPEDRATVSTVMTELGFAVGRYNWKRGTIGLDRKTELTYKLNPDHLPHFSRLVDDPILPCIMVDFANSLTWTNSPWQIPVAVCLERVWPHSLPGGLGPVPRLVPPFQFLFTILHLFREAWLQQTVASGNDVDLARFGDVLHCFRRERAEIIAGGFRELVDEYKLRAPVLWVLEHLDRTLQTEVVPALGWEGQVSEEWLASAQPVGGRRHTWRGTMRERLHRADRRVLFTVSD